MKKLCDLFVAKAGLIGALYCIVLTFTHFIASNGMSDTKTLVLAIWFIAGVLGAIIGGVLGFVGAKYLGRETNV